MVLSGFNSDSLSGTWTLVTDSVGSDVGTLVSWCLVPTTGTAPTATPTLVPPTPTPTPTGGCTNGNLSGTGANVYLPSTTGYASGAGVHTGTLSGPIGVDFDLYLQKQGATGAWSAVAPVDRQHVVGVHQLQRHRRHVPLARAQLVGQRRVHALHDEALAAS